MGLGRICLRPHEKRRAQGRDKGLNEAIGRRWLADLMMKFHEAHAGRQDACLARLGGMGAVAPDGHSGRVACRPFGAVGVCIADGLTTHSDVRDPRIEEVNPMWRWLFARVPPAIAILAPALGALLLPIETIFMDEEGAGDVA